MDPRAHNFPARLLPPLQGGRENGFGDPGVSLRSTPGYDLAYLRHARFTTDEMVIY